MLDYQVEQLVQEGATVKGSQVTNFRELRVGAGESMFGFGGEGGWMGASNFASSPIKFDYQNKRILMNDGTTDRVLIGYGAGLF